VDASKQAEIIQRHTEALQKAGDENRCDAEVERVRTALAADPGFTDADLEQNLRDYDTKGKGPMPYPSPGTACAIFGRVRALGGAIEDRRGNRVKEPSRMISAPDLRSPSVQQAWLRFTPSQ
jgi:hypothetical protein